MLVHILLKIILCPTFWGKLSGVMGVKEGIRGFRQELEMLRVTFGKIHSGC